MKNDLHFYEHGNVEILYGKSNHCFPTHSHECFCIGSILAGNVLFNINNKERLLKKSDIFIIPSNTAVKFESDSTYEYVTICFKNELKTESCRLSFNDYYASVDDSNKFMSLCTKFKNDNDEDDLYDSILDLAANVISYKYEDKNTCSNTVVADICRYIIDHADQKFDLDKLSKTFFISKFHLIRIFKKEMGITPNQYHMQAKMRMLKSGILKNKSETSLAMDLNLTDESHLCKMFRKYMGISIQSYKKNYKNK